MKPLLLLLPVLLVMTTHAFAAAKREMDADAKAAVDRAIAAAIELRMTPGAVVVAGRGDGVVFEKAYGKMTYDDNASPMTADTIGTSSVDITNRLRAIASLWLRSSEPTPG